MRTQGFLGGTGAFIVERIPGMKEQYVVLEGNRRTTAIKKLLEHKEQLPRHLASTLEVISVNEFRYREGSPVSRDDVVDIYLGTIHISGQLEWGALEKALYIFRSYQRDRDQASGRVDFSLSEDGVERLSKKFSTDKGSIRKAIWVSRVYEQLRRSDYPMEPNKFSLLELCVTDKRLRNDFFRMSSACEFSSAGLEYFNSLFLTENAPIRNPDQFKMFKVIERNGEPSQLRALLTGSCDLSTLYTDVVKKNEESKVLSQLIEVRDRLRALNISGFAADKEEEAVLIDIQDIVVKKLLVLVRQSETSDFDGLDIDYKSSLHSPRSVLELISLNDSHIQELIKAAMKDFPNRSCVKAALPIKVLRHIGVRTAGGPRQQALKFIERHLDCMIRLGLVQEYKAGNLRVRLLVD